MGVVFSDTFTGTNNAAWDVAKWTTSETNATSDILSNEGRLAVTSGSTSNTARAIAVMAPLENAEARLTYRWTNKAGDAAMRLRIWNRASGTWEGASVVAETGYNIWMDSNSTTVRLNIRTPGVGATLQTNTTAQPDTLDPIRVAFRAEGTRLKAKWWLASAAEPSAWNLDTLNITLTEAGFFQVNAYALDGSSVDNHVLVDDLKVHSLAEESFAPYAILSKTNLSGTIADIQDDPDAPDANWLTA